MEIRINSSHHKESSIRAYLKGELAKLDKLSIPYRFVDDSNILLPKLRNKYYNFADYLPIFYEFYREAVGIKAMKKELNEVAIPYITGFEEYKNKI